HLSYYLSNVRLASSLTIGPSLKNQIPKGYAQKTARPNTPSRPARDDDLLPAFRRRCLFARAGLMWAGRIERIERRYDLLAVLGVKIEVSKGVHQRDVFGAQIAARYFFRNSRQLGDIRRDPPRSRFDSNQICHCTTVFQIVCCLPRR